MPVRNNLLDRQPPAVAQTAAAENESGPAGEQARIDVLRKTRHGASTVAGDGLESIAGRTAPPGCGPQFFERRSIKTESVNPVVALTMIPSKPAPYLAAFVLAMAAGVGPVAGQSIGAGGVALVELLAAEALTCTFTSASGGETAVAGGAPAPSPPAMLTIEFRDINVGRAAAAGGDIAIDGDVRIMPTNLGLHFYQFSTAGALSLVTITAVRDESGRYTAALSRHHTDQQVLHATQLVGTCTVITPPG